jgi:undecaprenyl-diphosphatase
MLSLIEVVILGALQGILEWLPVSSEGNIVVLLIALLGIAPVEAVGLTLFLHIGTGFAALLYYRNQAVEISFGSTKTNSSFRLKIIIITGITGGIGFPLYLGLNVSELYGETLLAITGIALILTGLLQRNREQISLRDYSSLSWAESISLGILQGLSIIPGISRSGITTSMLLLRGFSGEQSFRISFIMSIPASFAAGIGLILINGFEVTTLALIGVVVSTIVGFLMIGALTDTAKRTSFWKLCILLGALVILFYIPNLI